MKTFCLTTLIGIFLLICANGVQAQPTQTQPHQIDLMKVFLEILSLMPIKSNRTLKTFKAF
jgi:hypothetical protein